MRGLIHERQEGWELKIRLASRRLPKRAARWATDGELTDFGKVDR